MKTRLPKTLLVALGIVVLPCAAAESGPVLDPTATQVTPGTIVGNDKDLTITEIPDSWKISNEVTTPIKHAKPYLKDGVDTTLTVQGVEGTVANPLYVREGKAIINDSTIKVNLASAAQAMINVAGNKAELTLNNTKYEDVDCEAYLEVGGPDGEGVLNLNGESKVRVVSLLAGFNWRASWNDVNPMINSTAATTAGGNRYKNGVYTYNAEADRYFGAAIININKGSELELGTTAFLTEAKVNVNGGLLDVGADNTVTPLVLGRQNACSTELNVSNGGTVQTNTHVDVQTGDYFSGAKPSSVKITVSGSGSKLLVGRNLQIGFDTSRNKEGQSIFEVTEGGYVKAESITFGRADAAGSPSNQVLATIGAGSTIHTDALNVLAGSTLTNKGTIDGGIFVDGATFTMADGAVAAGLTATSGTVNLSGNVTFTGAVNLGEAVSESVVALLGNSASDTLTVYIAKDTNIVLDDSILSVDGQQFVVGDNTEIIVDLGNVAYEEGTQLFTLSGSDGTLLTDTAAALEDKVTVTWEDESGTRQEASGNEVSGSIATVVVPEPTTATLSLLALAGLCARRRRK